MHPEGRRFVGIFAVATVILWWISPWLGLVGLGGTVWCYYFFRDPKRAVPGRAGLMISPADGIVSMIVPAAPPPELELGEAPLTRISVFMNVFNCHVNRAPVPGMVGKIAYRPGKFLNASLDKASEDNERNGLRIDMDDGRSIGVVQIAGLVARRIVCFTHEGAHLERGERFGLIRFGSRLDIYLPDGVNPLVFEGQSTLAGETILADLANNPDVMTGRME